MTDQAIVGGEERAREILAAAFGKLPHGRARAESFRVPAYTTDDDRVILSAMLTFAAEASGIGVLLSAIDAWMADPSPETEQAILDARELFAAPSTCQVLTQG